MILPNAGYLKLTLISEEDIIIHWFQCPKIFTGFKIIGKVIHSLKKKEKFVTSRRQSSQLLQLLRKE